MKPPKQLNYFSISYSDLVIRTYETSAVQRKITMESMKSMDLQF
jgi:hypothetical protein